MKPSTRFQLFRNSSRRTWVVLGLIALSLLTSTRDARAAPKFTLFVTNTADSGVGSLRWAVATAPFNTDIYFSLSSCPCTIALISGEIAIGTELSIVGLGQSMLAISGNNASRVFNVTTTNPVSISDVTIKNGTGSGAGIYNSSNNLILTNITLSDNNSGSGNGGALGNDTGTVTLMASTISDNRANNLGGGIYNGGVMTITGSLISGNTMTATSADQWGGGIYNYGTALIMNSTITGNSAAGGTSQSSGGGVWTKNSGGLTLINSTVSGNSANSNYGGGIAVWFVNSNMLVTNSILANNPSGGNCRNYSGNLYQGGNNIDDDGTCGWDSAFGSLSGVNPLLGPLANNGGATLTLRLLPGSPAIDGVTYNAPNSCPPTDQRGTLRPIGVRCDIGAFEAPIFYLFPLILK